MESQAIVMTGTRAVFSCICFSANGLTMGIVSRLKDESVFESDASKTHPGRQ
jgi:hypothetical protein